MSVNRTRLHRLCVGLACLLLFCAILPMNASAAPLIETSRPVTLTLNYRPSAGVEFSLYRVADVSSIVEFTGYNRHTVCEWIRFGKLRALALQHKYMIPKCYLIDWLSTDEHNATLRKSRRHVDRLWELQKWSDGQ